jgi:hypothetical protein
MNTREFFELLLPSTGFIFTATPLAVKGWANTSHQSIDEAIAHAHALTFNHKNAFYAVATYNERRVWDASANDGEGKWRYRTQENATQVKSFFLDLDVDPADPLKFDSKQQALAELKAFVQKVGLPRPLLVDSGGGIHAYWPLDRAVSTAEWRPVADRFKAICVHERFRADRSLTSDQARVLRVPGTFNFKRNHPVLILSTAPAIGFADFAQRIAAYANRATVPLVAVAGAKKSTPPVPGQPAASVFGDNLGTTNDPLNFDRITFACPQLQLQVASRGAHTGEQLWRAALGVVKFCDRMELAAAAVSDAHPEYSPAATRAKLDNWHTGPTACAHFHQLNPAVCESCPNWTKIVSPAVLGRQVIEAPTPQVVVVTDTGAVAAIKLPDPPKGYARRKHDSAIVLETEDGEGNPSFEVVCPYDLYPLALRAQSGVDSNIDERSMWRVHLPLERGKGRAVRDIDVPLALMADTKALAKHLMAKGIILNGDQPKLVQHYMSAYLQKLADEAGREKLYERLGWHDEHHTFVLGDRVYRRDGTVNTHVPSAQIRNTTKSGLRPGGTFEGWKKAMQFYNRAGFEGHRFFMYASLGAPIFHMNDTGNKGVLMTASGQSGRGKTTCLKACGSIWGHPEALVLNGNKDGSTVNALYSAIGTTHSLPFMWDDITERDPDELRRFLLNISQGQGKRRMTSDANQAGHVDTWETIVLATANTDDISRILSSGRDVNPHLMRMVGVEFTAIDQGVEAKIKADDFLRELNANYGHVGPVYMKVLVTQYEAIRRGYIKNIAAVDRLLASSNASAERYWSATVAAAYTGAQIARSLGLIDFPIDTDLQWMVGHLTQQRTLIQESSQSPLELLVAFLNNHLRNTLIVGAKVSSNLDNVVQKPTDALLVRNELDTNTIYISRTAIMAYCADQRIAFKPLESSLVRTNRVIADHNVQKVLGADTVYASGQTRCWKIDATKLGGAMNALPPGTPAAHGTPSNVIPLQAGARK